MTTKFYENIVTLQAGTTARAEAVEAKFDAVEAALDQVGVATDSAVKLTNPDISASQAISANAATRANQVIGFDETGNLALKPAGAKWRGNWAPGVYYTVNDIVVDAAGAVGLNNIYISKTSHLSVDFAADIAKWDQMIDVGAVETARAVAELAAATATTQAGTATTQAGIATAQAGIATTQATNAANSAVYAAEWANKAEDSLVSGAAGGDGVDDYSALHWASKAAASAAAAAIDVAAVWDSRFNGFGDNSRHVKFTGDLDTILYNSVYNIEKATVSNAPSELSSWGFVHTLVHSNNTGYATQIIHSMNSGVGKMWVRVRSASVWGDWVYANLADMATATALALKFDKSGGAINGNVTIAANLTLAPTGENPDFYIDSASGYSGYMTFREAGVAKSRIIQLTGVGNLSLRRYADDGITTAARLDLTRDGKVSVTTGQLIYGTNEVATKVDLAAYAPLAGATFTDEVKVTGVNNFVAEALSYAADQSLGGLFVKSTGSGAWTAGFGMWSNSSGRPYTGVQAPTSTAGAYGPVWCIIGIPHLYQDWLLNGTVLMRLNAAGKLLIGTTSDAGDYKLQVNGSGLFNGPVTWGASDSATTGVLTGWTSSDTAIDALTPGSTFGALIKGPSNGHLTFALRENGSDAGVQIISGGGDYTADSTYDTLVFEARADGRVGIPQRLFVGAPADPGSIYKFVVNSTAYLNGSLICVDPTPGIHLVETDGGSNYNEAWLVLSSNTLGFQSRDGSGGFISNDYRISRNASGASSHVWGIGNTDKLMLDAGGWLRTDQIRTLTGQQVVIAAGESSSQDLSAMTEEKLYVVAETGLQVYSSPDDWTTGIAAANVATICDANGESFFPNTVYVTDTAVIASAAGEDGSLFFTENGVTEFRMRWDASAGAMNLQTMDGAKIVLWESGVMTFLQNATEVARIPASGNGILVGTVDEDLSNNTGSATGTRLAKGQIQVASSGVAALHLNRLTSDGHILALYREGAWKGALAVASNGVDLVDATGSLLRVKAFVNMTGGISAAINNAKGISSVTYLGTGKYRLNFASAFPDTAYTVLAMATEHDTSTSTSTVVVASLWSAADMLTTSVIVGVRHAYSLAQTDPVRLFVAILDA